MEYINNSEFWKCFNDYTTTCRSISSSSQDLTIIQKNAIDVKLKLENEKLEIMLQKYIGRFMQCKAQINEISDDKLIVNVYGVLINYLTYFSSEKESKDAQLSFYYDNSFRKKLLALQKSDEVKLTGKIISLSNYNNIFLQLISIEKSGCFIASACYDNYADPAVMVLQQFRDDTLLKNYFGRVFVKFYYYVSPFFALIISKSDLLKKIVKKYFLEPIIKKISDRITYDK